MPRTQISDDGTVRVWRLTDAQGNVIGQAVELYVLPTVDTNANDLRAKAVAALAGNSTFLTNSAAVTAPLTNAQTNALVAQVRALTKQNDALLRLVAGQLDSVVDT